MQRSGQQLSADDFAAVELDLKRITLALEDLAHSQYGTSSREWIEEFDLTALIETVVASYSNEAALNGSQLTVDSDEGRLTVVGSQTRIAQACSNLISNAFQHGSGPIVVSTKKIGSRAVVEITNQQSDADSSVSSKLRVRSRDWCARRGRGLTVTAEVVDRHGGALYSEYTESGSKQTVELPVVATAYE